MGWEKGGKKNITLCTKGSGTGGDTIALTSQLLSLQPRRHPQQLEQQLEQRW